MAQHLCSALRNHLAPPCVSWLESRYSSLPLKRSPWVFNIPDFPSAYLWAQVSCAFKCQSNDINVVFIEKSPKVFYLVLWCLDSPGSSALNPHTLSLSLIDLKCFAKVLKYQKLPRSLFILNAYLLVPSFIGLWLSSQPNLSSPRRASCLLSFKQAPYLPMMSPFSITLSLMVANCAAVISVTHLFSQILHVFTFPHLWEQKITLFSIKSQWQESYLPRVRHVSVVCPENMHVSSRARANPSLLLFFLTPCFLTLPLIVSFLKIIFLEAVGTCFIDKHVFCSINHVARAEFHNLLLSGI